MNNFRKEFIAKKGSCFKMEERSPLGKVEGEGEGEKGKKEKYNEEENTTYNEDGSKIVIGKPKKYKFGKGKGSTKRTYSTTFDADGNIVEQGSGKYKRGERYEEES